IAEQLGRTLSGGETVLLSGEMGAGKTHFVKGIAVGLEISDVITSPTFALHNSYTGRLTLNHFDFYRIDDSSEVEILGLNEFFYDDRGVSVIEWGENIADLIPANSIRVTIEKISESRRRITLKR
ncbi:MAG: tRNA (adenosine(37)-N6)-threonylcarbamoyltransferase complex ATPase subunit type 1 TsaE, partial [Clostridia bacterium]|nr:tRNA (adenosine(37)-N6)-threonylcarbamoyltransferase complex ATPase subunit type 1 TsaE [Clostridia bacterium]